MKGEIGTNMMLVLVLAVAAAALVIGAFMIHSSNAEQGLNSTSDTTSDQISNASCERECKTNHPGEGPAYQTCLQTNGCRW